ncbi:MAG: class I SAM-dependent methyltransferase [Spirochaetaceae bacterium]|nr:class I SAM-dependent methyltransferase [Spirochaetaceae bacterium]
MSCRLCGGRPTLRLMLGESPYEDCLACGYLGLSTSRFLDRRSELERYRLHRNDPGESGYRAFLESFIEAAIAPYLARGASILDFGSGPRPALAELLLERGWDAAAYDPFFAPGDAWRRRSWDAATVHEVAEHLRSPYRSLSALASRIAPGGFLAIRTRFAPESAEELASWWYRLDPTHIGFFREKSFAVLAGRIGMTVSKIQRPDVAVLTKPRP